MAGGGPVYLLAEGAWLFGLNGYYLEGDADPVLLGYGGASVGRLFSPSRGPAFPSPCWPPAGAPRPAAGAPPWSCWSRTPPCCSP